MSKIAIIGAGAWGTALSIILGRKESHEIRLWAHEKEVCESISQRRVNEIFLPGQHIPACVTPCNDLAEALAGAAIVVSVMPSQHCRQLFEQMRPHLSAETMIVSATKGLEEASFLRMTEVIAQVVKAPMAFPHRGSARSAAHRSRSKRRGEIRPQSPSLRRIKNSRAPSSRSSAMPAFAFTPMKIRSAWNWAAR